MVSKNVSAPLKGDGVLFLHGIGRSAAAMKSLEAYFQKQGYRTLSLTYPSRRKNLQDLAVWLHANPEWRSFQDSFPGKYHFVTHSMGGLLVREYLHKYRAEVEREGRLGRVVMIGPPLKGSEIADAYHRLLPYKKFYGPAGQQLTTSYQKDQKHDIYYDLGSIAGTNSLLYPDSFLIKGPNDGRVSVESTKVEGMKDHHVLHATHTFIINRKDTATAAHHFILHGTFEK